MIRPFAESHNTASGYEVAYKYKNSYFWTFFFPFILD